MKMGIPFETTRRLATLLLVLAILLPAAPVAGQDDGVPPIAPASEVTGLLPEVAAENDDSDAATPAGAPDAAPAPGVTVTLAGDRLHLAPGATTMLTLTVAASEEAPVTGLEVTLAVPPGLTTAQGETGMLRWPAVAVAAGAPFVQAVALTVQEAATAAAVATLTAEVSQGELTLAAAGLALGLAAGEMASSNVVAAEGAWVASEDGEIVVLAPGGVLPAGATLQLHEIAAEEDTARDEVAHTPEDAPAATQELTSTVAPTTTGVLLPDFAHHAFLPHVGADAAMPAAPAPGAEAGELTGDGDADVAAAAPWRQWTRQAGSLHAFRLWQLDAQQGTGEVATFDGEVTLVVAVGAWLDRGVPLPLLRLWTRAQEDEPWTPLATTFDAEQRTLTAHLPHFSQFGLGAGLVPSGDMLPSVKPFSVDALDGGASLHLPIDTPPGLGGLSPDLAFAYSSILLDDLRRSAGDNVILTQAGAAGIGWSLTGLSYIARTDQGDRLDSAKQFALVLGGQRTAITFQGGRWRTNPETFARIDWSGADNGSGYIATDYAPWAVTTPDGTRYDFGDAGVFPGSFVPDRPTATLLADTNAGNDMRMAHRWYLRKVTDPLGNSMEYRYRAEQATETGCLSAAWQSGRGWYTRSMDPVEILWSGNPSQGMPYRLRVLFSYAPRSDTQLKGTASGDCLQPLYGANNRLTSVTVQVFSEGSWQTLRSYHLAQSTPAFDYSGTPTMYRLRLDAVEERGKNGGLLNRYSFTYLTHKPNLILLQTVSNGRGGRVTYSYARHKASCSSSACPGFADSLPSSERHAVVATVAEDGLGGSVRTSYYYGPTASAGSEWSAVAEDGGFLGFAEVQVTHFDVNSSAVLQWERLQSVGNTTGAEASRRNPDPRRGQLGRREVWSLPPGSAGAQLLAAYAYDWKAYWLQNGAWNWTERSTSWYDQSGSAFYPVTWVRQAAATTTLYTPANGSSVSNRSVYAYDGYGNRTQVEEWADGQLLRRTHTEFMPRNDPGGAYLVNRPARVRLYDSGGTCRSEMRSIYDNVDGVYTTPPVRGLLTKEDRALASCSDVASLWSGDSNWQEMRYAYDGYGNRTVAHAVGGGGASDDWVVTEYDPTYRLFPLRQYHSQQPALVESAAYYGVDAISSGESRPLSDGWAYWGAAAEQCGVNELCIRHAYDEHGRRTLRWEGVGRGAGWATQSTQNAAVRWEYRDPLANPGWQTTVVSEWRAPRCEGNFVRRHYDGFGQLVHEQAPDQTWQVAYEGCGVTQSPLAEIDVHYAYDGLGRQVRVSVPLRTTAGWVNRPADWRGGFTATGYDALGRVIVTVAPNGSRLEQGYGGRITWQMAKGREGEGDKLVRWQQVDGLGRLALVRTYGWTGSSWGMEGEVALTHDVMGNLVRVAQAGGLGVTTFSYDLGGRKTAMSDGDLGTWRYAYDRQGKLVWQADARNAVTCLRYDNLGRVSSKVVAYNATCSVPGATVTYSYDAGHGGKSRSRGQLTSVAYADGRWEKVLTYDARGLLASERVKIAGAPQLYTTHYAYDSYRRPSATTYPDGEQVSVGYNSRGLPAWLRSNWHGVLVDGATAGGVGYDAAGRAVSLRLGGSVWRTLVYAPENQADNQGGRLSEVRAGSAAGGATLLQVRYGYDSYGNVRTIADGTGNHTFGYDSQNRLTTGYGRSYSYDAAGRLVGYEGASLGYNGVQPVHGVKGSAYAYDANGNLLRRPGQTLAWDVENRLAAVNGSVREQYLYDVDGQRVKKVAGGMTSYYPFAHYEVSNGVAVRYYFFGGQRVAMRRGTGAPVYLHSDPLGSTLLTTGAASGSQRYYAYGRTRAGGGLATDRTFTGQQQDGSGLLYMNARYYDPQTGQFVSPDTLVPDAGNLFDYNRFMYARGNPLRYSDPTGHCVFGIDSAICLIIAAAVGIGGVAGAGVDVAKQIWLDDKDLNSLDLGEVVGSGVAGGVGGGIVALVPPSAGLLPAIGIGALGGAVGGQAGTVARATYDKFWGGKANSEVFELAISNGFLDPSTISIDAVSGVVGGAVGHAGSRVLGGLFSDTTTASGVTILRDPIPMIRWEQSIDEPGRWVFRNEGRTIAMPASTATRLFRALSQGTLEEAQSILEESVSQGTTEILGDD